MIRLDLENLSQEQMHTVIRELCSAYGAVERVSITRNGTPNAIASIVMQERDSSLALRKALGDLLVDNSVLLRIEQE